MIHIDFLSLTHRFTLPRNRRWFESLKGRCFLKSPLPSHTSNTLSGSTTCRVRENGKHSTTPALLTFTYSNSHHYFQYVNQIFTPGICKTRSFLVRLVVLMSSCIIKQVSGFCLCRKSVLGGQQCNLRKLIEPWDRKNSEFRNP